MDSYSGLEVASHERYPNDNYSQNYSESLQTRSPSTFPEAVPFEYNNYNNLSVGAERKPPKTDLPTPPIDQQTGRRICGLPIRLFYKLSAVVAVVIIGAIVGGVAGGVSSSKRHKQQDHSTEPDTGGNGGNSTTPTNSYILPTSKVSATNWTDPSGLSHRFVFFQDISGAIVARRWDPQNSTWYTNNLTDIFQTSRAPINPLSPSTPLASASMNFNNTQNQIQLWYIAPDNTIASVEVSDLVNAPLEWEINTLSGTTLETYPGSQLAASWNRCWGLCAGYWALAYQRPGDAGINVANGSNFDASLAINSNSVVVGSSLALTPEVQLDGSSVSRLTMMSESLSNSDSGKAYKWTYEDSWSQDGPLLSGALLPTPSSTLQFAISLLDNFRTVVFLALLPNGTVTGQYYRKMFISIPNVMFIGGPSDPNFTAIAASEEGLFYGISRDEINQYSINDTDPSVFEFVDRVFP
ncbi:hypothetical protein F4678DRAFT_485973 [Xylaria arbuscula]|nr:hypothetical protein F4678DRAFT_485973 [Xylaria arbuscula]